MRRGGLAGLVRGGIEIGFDPWAIHHQQAEAQALAQPQDVSREGAFRFRNGKIHRIGHALAVNALEQELEIE